MVRFGLLGIIVVFTFAQAASASYLYGVDVSHWRTVSSWTSVENSGKTFMFTKASEDANYVDPTLNSYMTGAHNVGMYAGAFHFATPYAPTRNDVPDASRPSDAIAEADHFVDTIKPFLKEGYLRPVLDLEFGYQVQATKLSQWVCDFVERVKYRTRIEPLIYCNSNYASNYLDSSVAKYDLWLARWTYDPNVPPTTANLGVWRNEGWDFWQYANNTSVPGISGGTDGDVFEGTVADLREEFMIPLSGDANRDGIVDVGDLGILAGNYGTTSDATWRQGDFNNTGSVDISDLGILAGHYGQMSTFAAAMAVPEPITPALLSLGGLGLIRRKR
jgi:GH25 family lysozyme M1 (1,4-beta-N-acetylmuramidase)